MKKLFFACLFLGLSCSDGDGLILFPVSKDKQLGAQVNNEILKDTTTYPILSEDDYPEAYTHIRRILNEVLKSDAIEYKNEFAYQDIKIINQNILNAFATPGGYIYVYTGLIHYLNHEDHLAGVLGHEIAHAEKRHSISALQLQMGVQFLLDVVLGEKQGLATQVLSNLVTLKFSRDNETESDLSAVEYLSATSTYQCNGASGFFRKLQEENTGGGTPEFLSTHPSPDNRVGTIDDRAKDIGCNTELNTSNSYQEFKNSLPPL